MELEMANCSVLGSSKTILSPMFRAKTDPVLPVWVACTHRVCRTNCTCFVRRTGIRNRATASGIQTAGRQDARLRPAYPRPAVPHQTVRIVLLDPEAGRTGDRRPGAPAFAKRFRPGGARIERDPGCLPSAVDRQTSCKGRTRHRRTGRDGSARLHHARGQVGWQPSSPYPFGSLTVEAGRRWYPPVPMNRLPRPRLGLQHRLVFVDRTAFFRPGKGHADGQVGHARHVRGFTP